MEEKKIDNVIYNNENKNKIKEIDLKLEQNDNQLHELDILENQYKELNKKLNKCVELIGMSITGKDVAKKLDNINNSTKMTFSKAMSYVDERREETYDVIKELNNLKEEYISKEKKDSKDEEENKNQL